MSTARLQEKSNYLFSLDKNGVGSSLGFSGLRNPHSWNRMFPEWQFHRVLHKGGKGTNGFGTRTP